MAPSAKYLTGDKAAIDEFIDKFDVGQEASPIAHDGQAID